jgi:hypothetical protein
VPHYDQIGAHLARVGTDLLSRLTHRKFGRRFESERLQALQSLAQHGLVLRQLLADPCTADTFAELGPRALGNYRQQKDLGVVATGHQRPLAQATASFGRAVVGEQNARIHTDPLTEAVGALERNRRCGAVIYPAPQAPDRS